MFYYENIIVNFFFFEVTNYLLFSYSDYHLVGFFFSVCFFGGSGGNPNNLACLLDIQNLEPDFLFNLEAESYSSKLGTLLLITVGIRISSGNTWMYLRVMQRWVSSPKIRKKNGQIEDRLELFIKNEHQSYHIFPICH